MKKTNESSEIKELTFEEAFAELEETVSRLERGDLSLEASIALFERGRALSAHCGQQLDEADLKVRQLLPGSGMEGIETEDETVPFEMEQE
jgi:exodeoxyribonuclease VII small subunit